MSQQLNETTLGSVFGAPGDPNGGIFIGPLSGVSKKIMHRRLLYPTYGNSTGKNTLVHNALSEEFIYNTEGKEVTGTDVEKLCELGLTNKMMFKGGKYLHIEPKCASFPYCDQGAPGKPVKLISGTKEGMCEGCGKYCSVIAEQSGKSLEYVAEGFRNYTLNKLSEMTNLNEQKVTNFLSSIENSVQPSVFIKIKEFLTKDKIDPDNTFEDLLREVNHLMVKSGARELSESIENLDNNTKQNINEMKGKKLELKHKAKGTKKEILESLMKSSVAKCMCEQLQKEGFLPVNDELNESLTLESSMETMMEDHDLINEMFEAITEAKCDCSDNIKKHIKEKYDWQKEDESDDEDTDDWTDESDGIYNTKKKKKSTNLDGDEDSYDLVENDDVVDGEVEDEEVGDEEITDIEPEIEVIKDIEIDGDGGDDTFQSLIDTLLSLQTKYASDENGADTLGAINSMLTNAKSLKDQEETTGTNITGELADELEIEDEDALDEATAYRKSIIKANKTLPKTNKDDDDEDAFFAKPNRVKTMKDDGSVGSDYKAKLVDTMFDFRREFIKVFSVRNPAVAPKDDVNNQQRHIMNNFVAFCKYYDFEYTRGITAPTQFDGDGTEIPVKISEEQNAEYGDFLNILMSNYTAMPPMDGMKGETDDAFLTRLWDVENDHNGYTNAFQSMLNPNKRGFFKQQEAIASKSITKNLTWQQQRILANNRGEDFTAHEPVSIKKDEKGKVIPEPDTTRPPLPHEHQYDKLEDICSILFDKYDFIAKSANPINSDEVIDDEKPERGITVSKDDDEEEAENSVDKYGKDDEFVGEFGDTDKEPTADELTRDSAKSVAQPKDFNFGKGYDDDDAEFGDEDLNESALPMITAGVMASNKETAKQNDVQAKDAIASQKTVDQKVDGMKNQKFTASPAQKAIQDKGTRKNNLDLDYDTELTDARKDQILTQVKGLAPKDHVNVDHDSKGGEALIQAAKDRAPQTAKDYSSIPDGVTIKQEDQYKTTTAVNEDLERMRKLIMFDATKLKEKRSREKVDEVKFLTEKIQTKKFL